MDFIRLIKAELLMLLGELKHYYINNIFYNLGILVMFLGVLYNFNNNNTFLLLIGLVIWQTCTSSMGYLSNVIQDEAMMGTLEQIFLTKTKVQKILFGKIIVNFSFVVFKSIILFLICLIIFKSRIYFEDINLQSLIIAFLIIFIITISFYFIGELFGGICLYFKRVGSVIAVINNVLLLFSGVINSVDKSSILFYITPISSGLRIINSFITQNFTTIMFDVVSFSTICFLYIIIGIYSFKLLLYSAKITGNLGQY